MKKNFQRLLGLVLALALIAGQILIPAQNHVHAANVSAQSTVDSSLADYVQDGVTLHCWNWSVANIKANLGLIANMGYSAIQLSPM